MAKAKKAITLYVLRRTDWEVGLVIPYCSKGDPDPRPFVLESFLGRETAEAHRTQLEREMRGDQNPFDYGDPSFGLTDYTTLSVEAFLVRLEAAGVVVDVWADLLYWEWFNELKPTDEQRHAIWEALDRVRLFEVAPMEIELEA